MSTRLMQTMPCIMKAWLLFSVVMLTLCCQATGVTVSIHYGKEVNNTEFPYFVGLTEEVNGGYRCGGTLISKDTVLTAAHCVYDFAPKLIANIGMDERSPLEALERVPVKQIFIPGQYGKVSGMYDIAILKLAHAVTATHAYMPLKEWNISDGAEVYAIGFGKTEKGGMPNHLLGASFQMVNWYAHCSGHNYPKGYPPTHFDPHYHLCTQSYTDGGDSGGPVMNQYEGKFYQIGIVSRGLLNAGQQTRVSAYYDWIARHIK